MSFTIKQTKKKDTTPGLTLVLIVKFLYFK